MFQVFYRIPHSEEGASRVSNNELALWHLFDVVLQQRTTIVKHSAFSKTFAITLVSCMQQHVNQKHFLLCKVGLDCLNDVYVLFLILKILILEFLCDL